MNEQAKMMNPQKQQQQQQMMNMNQNPMMSMGQMSQAQQQMAPMNRSYGMWIPPMQPQPQPQPLPQFPNPNPVSGMKQPSFHFGKSSKPLGPRNNWKGKNVKNDKRRMEKQKSLMAGSSTGPPAGGVNVTGNMNFNNYIPPTVNELQYQNRLKTRKFFSKKKFNKNNNSMNMNMGVSNNKNNRSAPFAPRNTSSYIIRAKKSGGIASLVSPCPVTPAVLPTPIFSPSSEVFVDMAKEEWGVDGYGSMKGLIRLRSPGHELVDAHEDEEEDDGGSSDSDVEEHVEVERRLDHDLSRFEMISNPHGMNVGAMDFHNVLENRVDDQDAHIAQLEEENLILKERLFLMEREFAELRRRLQGLEMRKGHGGEDINEEVVENESENESVSRGEETNSMEENNGELGEENVLGDGGFCGKDGDNSGSGTLGVEAEAINDQNVLLDIEVKAEKNNENTEISAGEEDKNGDESAEEDKTEKNILTVEGNKVDDGEKNKYVDGVVRAENNDIVEELANETIGGDGVVRSESNDIVEELESKAVAGDVCMENVGLADDKAISGKFLKD